MAEPTQSPLSGGASPFAPHNTPEKSDNPPPPSHPLTPAALEAHAARREPVRPVDGTSGWYAWTGEDLPRGGGGGGGGHGTDRRGGGVGGHSTGRGGGVRNMTEVTDERDTTRDQVPARGRADTGQVWRWFRNFKGARFTRPSPGPAGVPQPNKDNLHDGSGHTVTQPEATPPDSTNSSVITRIMRREQNAAAVRQVAVAARVAAMVFTLVAFSVLAADINKGWALDSYNKYSQFRYCETVNVIGFVYSGFQLYALVHHKRKQKHIIHRPLGDYFDFVMDQVLAYLLISASSSATARVRDWIFNWGTDPFPNMANGSIALTFLAFLAFAVSSLLSAYNLFGKTF
ncbi:CASP-like protein [Carex littledalei]|uniref:CASP-like protein n=1 Tax=Carex littledalei TaxID=544730 RepID=A0A833VXA7_9POAL|nr:CASP-like protein [Carex littledalei]